MNRRLGIDVQDGIATVYTRDGFQTAMGMQGLTRVIISGKPEELIAIAGDPDSANLIVEIHGQVGNIDTSAAVIVKKGVTVSRLFNGRVTIEEGGKVEVMVGGSADVYGSIDEVDGAEAEVRVKSGGTVYEVVQARAVHVEEGGVVVKQ